jgi:UDP-N-acetylmuramate dehydrogenase
MKLRSLTADELGLDYRSSKVREIGLILAGAIFHLTPKSPGEINEIVRARLYRRRIAQPPGVGTAGSVFKNPPEGFAGRMLEDAGVKGMQIGGARVSGRHANWIENTGAATASDVCELMQALRKVVADRFGVTLEPEIELVGEW